MRVWELLDQVKSNPPILINESIRKNIVLIKEICDQKYSNQSFYGNAALNRQMLLDPDIAKLLTPEVILYLFTNEPTSSEKIRRNSTGLINLRDAIYYGFKDGLYLIRIMPNNESGYGPSLHTVQKNKFDQNTLSIVSNIEAAAGSKHSEVPPRLDIDLVNQFSRIVKQISIIKENGGSAILLDVPGYTTKSMRSQVGGGFRACLLRLGISDLNKESLDSLAEKFLQSPNALLDGSVVHLFYDRAHLEAALEQNTTIVIGGTPFKYRDIIGCMVAKLSEHPKSYPDEALEQFTLRLGLVENDLNTRRSLEKYKVSPVGTVIDKNDDINKIEEILEAFNQKIKAIERKEPYNQSVKEAKQLYDELQGYKNDYALAKKTDPSHASVVFTDNCGAAMKQYLPNLDKDLGWGDWILNMLKQLANAVMITPANAVGIKLKFFEYTHTEVREEAGLLQQELEKVQPS